MEVTWLSTKVAVAPQLLPQEIGEIAAAGFTGIINNRPDGEELGQPSSAELEAQALSHGLSYSHIPIVPGKATEQDCAAFAAAVRGAGGPVVAFCRTGNRSALLAKAAGLAAPAAR